MISWIILCLLYVIAFFVSTAAFGCGIYQVFKGWRLENKIRERQGLIIMIPSAIVMIISLVGSTVFYVAIHVLF